MYSCCRLYTQASQFKVFLMDGVIKYMDKYIKWSYFWYLKIIARQTADEFYRVKNFILF